MQEETQIALRGRIHDTQHKEIQSLTSHVKKGKGKGRKFHGNKGKVGRSSPTLDQKKDVSHVCCYRCNVLGHYTQDCDLKKREPEASTVDVEEETSQKNSKNKDCTKFFF